MRDCLASVSGCQGSKKEIPFTHYGDGTRWINRLRLHHTLDVQTDCLDTAGGPQSTGQEMTEGRQAP